MGDTNSDKMSSSSSSSDPFSVSVPPSRPLSSTVGKSVPSAQSAASALKSSESGQTFYQRKTEEAENDLYDNPIWVQDMSYRGQQYRYLQHQSKVMGHLKVKLLEARDLKRKDWSYLSVGPVALLGLGNAGEVSSYMNFTLGTTRTTHSSCTIPNNANPSWGSRESFTLQLRKGAFEDDMRVMLRVEGLEAQTLVEAVMPTAVKGDKGLGVGGVDVTPLCMGQEDLLDCWISLDNPAGGRVHVLIAYEPNGIEPVAGDVVCLEAFARNPNNLLLKPDHPMQVVDRNGKYILVSYRLSNSRMGNLKLHRSAVFVVERLNFLDGLYNLALRPSDALLSTTYGRSAARLARPYVSYAGDLAKPAYYSGVLAVAAVRTTINATVEGVKAAGGAIGGAGTNNNF